MLRHSTRILTWLLALPAAGGLPVGATHFAWDGRDDAGKELPDGVYFARLFDAAHPRGPRTKIVLSRD